MLNGIEMIFSHHQRALIDSWRQWWQMPFTTLFTLITLALCLTLPLGLYTAYKNLAPLTDTWATGSRLCVFLNKDLSKEVQQTLVNTLAQDPRYQALHYESPEEVLANFSHKAQLPELTQHLPENPLPGVITLTPTHPDPANMQALKQHLLATVGVADVVVDLEWIQQLHVFLGLMKHLLWLLTAVFSVMAILVISNTLKLTFAQHEDEITLLSLIGATAGFIRRPFLYRGLWYGLGSGMLACLLTQGLILWIAPTLLHFFATTEHNTFGIQLLQGSEMLLFIGGCALLGWIGARAATIHGLASRP